LGHVAYVDEGDFRRQESIGGVFDQLGSAA
jgi:hypothetical protein